MLTHYYLLFVCLLLRKERMNLKLKLSTIRVIWIIRAKRRSTCVVISTLGRRWVVSPRWWIGWWISRLVSTSNCRLDFCHQFSHFHPSCESKIAAFFFVVFCYSLHFCVKLFFELKRMKRQKELNFEIRQEKKKKKRKKEKEKKTFIPSLMFSFISLYAKYPSWSCFKTSSRFFIMSFEFLTATNFSFAALTCSIIEDIFACCCEIFSTNGAYVASCWSKASVGSEMGLVPYNSRSFGTAFLKEKF